MPAVKAAAREGPDPSSKLVCVAGPQTVYQQAMRMTS